MKNKIFVVLLMSALAFPVVALTSEKFVESNAQKTILVTKAVPTFTLQLAANPTTGYRWVLQGNFNTQIVKPVAHAFHASSTKLIGAPGYESFTFKMRPKAFQVPTQTTITLRYLRPWDAADAAAAKQKTFTIISN